MLAQLQDDDKVFQEFKHSLSGNRPRYDLVQIITHSDFGLCYYIPYSPSGGSKITGAIYLPSGATLSEDGTADFSGVLGAPVKVDARKINHEINITKRYLYSIPFKKLQEQGVEVEPELTVYADLLNNKIMPVSPEECDAFNELQSRAMEPIIKIIIRYHSNYIGGRTDAVIGLSPQTLQHMIYISLQQMGVYVDCESAIRHVPYEEMHVGFPVSLIRMPEDTFLDILMQTIEYNAFREGFALSLQYSYSISGSSSGSSGVGSGTGGSSSGGNDSSTNSLKSPENESSERSKSILRDVSMLWRQLDSIYAATVGTNTYVTFQDYLGAVNNDPSREHSTILIDYGTEQYLTEVRHGTENGVSNDVSSAFVTAEIHNHPDGSPPSAKDLLFTAEMIQTKQDYKATFVYNHDDGSYYSLYVHDAERARGLYDNIWNEIDLSTNDFKVDGNCDKFLREHKKTYRGLSTEQQKIYRLCIVVAEYGGGGVSVTKCKSGSKYSTVYSVEERKGSDGKKTYAPLIYK